MTARPEGAPEWGPERSKTVTWYDPARTARHADGLSGLELMLAIAEGAIPPAPIAGLLGMRPVEVQRGRVVFECSSPGTGVRAVSPP